MRKVWNKYPECKPMQEGYYAVIEKFGNITTVSWKRGKFTIDDYMPDENEVFELITNVTHWAYLDDILPESARQGLIWKRRGQV